MRYEEQPEMLEISVRELAYAERERTLVAGAFSRLRTELGRLVHLRIQRELEPGQSEVPVQLERIVNGVRCRVHGRADIVREIDGVCFVDEIKSVIALEQPEDDAELGEAHSSGQMQVQLYALALADEGRTPVRARLLLAAIEGEDQVEYDVAFDREQVERTLEGSLRRALDRARKLATRAHLRRAAARSIRFPFASTRPGQDDLMAQIGEALINDRPVMLSAPTGTGKTAVAMVPALREGLRRGAAVWFLTAKTTQRQLAAQTFTAIQQASGVGLQGVVTRRKDDMCPPGHLRCHPDLCPFLADFAERAGPVLDALNDEVLITPDELMTRGRAAQLCPYELMHARVELADFVVADHGHVYDPRRSRGFMGRRLVIVDEAHNLVDRARDANSVFVGRALSGLDDPPVLRFAITGLQARVQLAIDAALAEAAEQELHSHEGQARVELAEDRVETWRQLGFEAGALALRYGLLRLRRRDIEPRDPVVETLQSIASLGEFISDEDPALVTCLAGPDAKRGPGIGVVCLDPSRRLERLHRRQDGVVVMSATLEPLDYFTDVLGLGRLNALQIRAPSSFPTENRCVCIVPSIHTKLDAREANAAAIAARILEVLSVQPGNYAAFFPSFRFLATISGCLDRAALSELDVELLIQPPGASEAIRAQFLTRLTRGERPTLLLAAAGGVFGEGIDLPSDALIGAIVVGPALPALSFERLLMQAHHREHGGFESDDAFAYAMVYPGMQRVIQAAGRVHRTPDDRGVIVLLGARFCQPPYCEALPRHWYDHAPDELLTGAPNEELSSRLRRFWDG